MTHPIVYAELHTSNPGMARTFYKDLFGWGMKVHTDFDYTEIQPGAGPGAGMMGLTPHDGDRPQWVTYVGVPDLDVAAARAVELGAVVRAPRTAVPGQGWFVWLDDPTGARFAPGCHVRGAFTRHLAELRRAIREQRTVRLGYADRNGAATARTVQPLGLFFWGSAWSLGAWCELRAGFRNFRLDRIVEASVLEDSFRSERGRTLQDFVRHHEAE